MKYRYRNVKSGETITTSNKVSGKNWEPVEDNTILNHQEDAFKDDTFEEDTFEDEAPCAEPDAEETPAENSKATRRGKK